MNKEVEYKTKLKLAISMLKPCACPVCDGSGIMEFQDSNGDWFPEQCEWCYTKDKLIKEENDSNNPG